MKSSTLLLIVCGVLSACAEQPRIFEGAPGGAVVPELAVPPDFDLLPPTNESKTPSE